MIQIVRNGAVAASLLKASSSWRPLGISHTCPAILTLSRQPLIMLITSANLIELKWKLIKRSPALFAVELIEAATCWLSWAHAISQRNTIQCSIGARRGEARRVRNSARVSIKLISIKSGCNLLHPLPSSSFFSALKLANYAHAIEMWALGSREWRVV